MPCKDFARRLKHFLRQIETPSDLIDETRTARMDCPRANFLDGRALLGKPSLERRSKMSGNQSRNARGKSHLKAIVSDPPSHGIFRVRKNRRAGCAYPPSLRAFFSDRRS